MKTLIKKKTTISNQDNLILLCDLKSKLSDFPLSKQELDYIKKEQKDKKEIVAINQYGRHIFVILPKQEKDANKNAENCRMLGDSLAGTLKDESWQNELEIFPNTYGVDKASSKAYQE